jgi:CarboxypepD_reg-like domain
MNNFQRSQLDACNRVKDFNTKNATVLAGIAEYSVEQARFMAAYGIITNATQVQSAAEGTTSEATRIAKTLMANTTNKYALRGAVKARQLNNITLANNLSHPVSYITHSPKTLAVQRAKDIKQHLSDNLAILTNITAANITELGNVITAYDNIKDNPTIDVQTRAATGTNPLPAAFAAATLAMNNMHDLVTSYFIDTNVPLVDEIGLSKQIINTGTHHNGVEGTVTKNGVAVMGASVSIVGTNKVATTDIKGHYIIAKIKIGDYTIEVSNKAGDTASKTIHINRGNFEVTDFTL